MRSVRAKNAFVRILAEVRERYDFSLVGFVVMPEHVHLLIGEPTRGTPSTVIQVLKQRVSRRLRRTGRAPADQLQFAFSQNTRPLPRFWQLRFYDFNVWSLKKRVEKLHYMHMNPLKRGPSEALAMEQLPVLLPRPLRPYPNRSNPVSPQKRTPKTPPLEKPEERAPANPKAKALPPVLFKKVELY